MNLWFESELSLTGDLTTDQEVLALLQLYQQVRSSMSAMTRLVYNLHNHPVLMALCPATLSKHINGDEPSCHSTLDHLQHRHTNINDLIKWFT